MTKTAKIVIYIFLGQKMGQENFLTIVLNSIFEVPCKDALYQKNKPILI